MNQMIEIEFKKEYQSFMMSLRYFLYGDLLTVVVWKEYALCPRCMRKFLICQNIELLG